MTSDGNVLPTWELILGPPSEAGGAGLRSKEAGFFTRLVRAEALASADELFDHFAAAFQFPWYFGKNWHAFDESFGELDQAEVGEGVVIVVMNGEAAADADPESLRSLVTSLGYAGEDWAAGDRIRAFRVVVQIDPNADRMGLASWERAGVDFE